MIMKTIYVLFISLLILSSSCSKFDDINTNPNAATTVTSSLLATPLLLNLTGLSPDLLKITVWLNK
jgi:hypothetical protein